MNFRMKGSNYSLGSLTKKTSQIRLSTEIVISITSKSMRKPFISEVYATEILTLTMTTSYYWCILVLSRRLLLSTRREIIHPSVSSLNSGITLLTLRKGTSRKAVSMFSRHCKMIRCITTTQYPRLMCSKVSISSRLLFTTTPSKRIGSQQSR